MLSSSFFSSFVKMLSGLFDDFFFMKGTVNYTFGTPVQRCAVLWFPNFPVEKMVTAEKELTVE